MQKYLITTAILTGLAACGGSTPAPTTRDAPAFEEDVTSASLPDEIVVAYTEATDTFSFAADGTTLGGLDPFAALDRGEILGFRDGAGDEFALVYRSDGGQVAVLGTEGIAPNFRGAQYARFGSTEVPLSGAATLTGDYAGIKGNRTLQDNFSDVRQLVVGDVSITADFADNTVSGSITNRALRNEAGGAIPATVEDIDLGSTTLDDELRFDGAATGGEVGAGATSNGSYQGALVGADGEEAIGVLTIDHTAGLQEDVEWGIFAAD